MTRRRGYSLVEVVLVMGALAVVLSLCVGSLQGLITLDRSSRARLVEDEALRRLARQFREDAHAARSGRVPAAGRLELRHSGDRLVEYRWEDGRLLRVESGPGGVDRREAYRLPGRGAPEFRVRDATQAPWVTMAMGSRADPAPLDPRREVRVEAWLGKDRRRANREGRE